MACELTTGRKLGCKSQLGGLKAVYFISYADISAIVLDSSTEEVESFTATSSSIFKFDLKGSNSLETAITSSDENGTTFMESTLNITLQKQDAATLKEIKLLAYNRPKVFVEDRNGNLFMLGRENGCSLASGSIVTGDALGDMSGYTLSFVAQEALGSLSVENGIANTSFAGALSGTQIDPA